MKNQKNHNFFVSLDLGTNSVGYAATNETYRLLKHQQHPVWGVHLFEKAKLAAERRTFRSARRRLDRRQQRIQLLRELFSAPVGKVDRDFFKRIDGSAVKKDSGVPAYGVFADDGYTDADFHRQYPTIHHLIAELIDSSAPHDVRLVYLACAWLLAHRGHFFSDVAKENVGDLMNFQSVYRELETFVAEHVCSLSWQHLGIDANAIGNLLRSSDTRTGKFKKLAEMLQVKKAKAAGYDAAQWFDEYEFLRLLCGLEVLAAKLFPATGYEQLKLSLDADDAKIAEMLANLSEDDASLLIIMKKIFDWSVLADIIGEGENISNSKVKIYEKHKTDLKYLKFLVKKYLPRADYQDIFRSPDIPNNYAAYCGSLGKKSPQEDFYAFLRKKLEKISVANDADKNVLEQIMQDIATGKFLPKQVISDNRTIPYQLYWNELNHLLTRAAAYLPFLAERDADGLSVKDKVLSIMEFRVPYFVGPLNSHSSFAWFKRKAEGRILPWNLAQKVDLDASEEAFIKRMVNHCTYLPGEPALPKQSLLYQKFEVLNLLNALHVGGVPISVSCKQRLVELFYKHGKVSRKMICSYLKANNIYPNITETDITGIDDTITASLSSWNIFASLLKEKKITLEEAEKIILKRTYTEDKKRFRAYLEKFPQLADEDIQKLAGKNFQGFGRLSKKFLTEPLYCDSKTGSNLSIINMMWEYNLNLQQLMSEQYPFAQMAEKARKLYYAQAPTDLSERLDEMYVSNAVKRPIIRALTILDEISHTLGGAPRKIFVEMARDIGDARKGQRTVSRMKQLQDLYRKIADDDARMLSKELEKYDESALQKDTLYLYFMQLGRDMYTGEVIKDLSLYNKEHIYPQAQVKDDSILNNIVLVRSEVNGAKTDSYPIAGAIRAKMTPFWNDLLKKNLITKEKFSRLTRSTPFSDDERWGFINRQLVETRQSTKVITELLKERYPESQVIYVKAGLVSDFRHCYNLVKSRAVNDLHHGKDAYLNIVVGNVWHEYFTRTWFDSLKNQPHGYSIKTDVFFGKVRKNIFGDIVWRGDEDIAMVRGIMKRNYLHLTNYTYCQHGGFFDQTPLAAASGLVPLKQGKPTEIYGGYGKTTASFFALALTARAAGKTAKKELTLVPVDLLVAEQFLRDASFAAQYVKSFMDPAGKKDLAIRFPLGLKPIKIKTVFELDNGLRFRLNGKSNGGKTLLISLFSPLLLDQFWEGYMKRLDSFCEKKRKNPDLIYSEKYDKFSAEENRKLYDILLSKLQNGLFGKRPANPRECLDQGRELFMALSPEKQAEILLEIVKSFGTGSCTGIDLRLLRGVANAAVTTLSSNLSNWKKDYQTAQIVYSDSSGLHETRSINLLDLI